MKPVITYFYREGCPSCKKIEPIINQFGKGYDLKKINTFENTQLVEQLEIEYVPTIVVEDENGNHLFEGPDEIKKFFRKLIE